MLILLSPSKTLDFDEVAPTEEATRPALLQDARQLIERLRELSPAERSNLMRISQKIATQVSEYLQAWEDQPRPACGKQALFAYRGDVYSGLNADEFSGKDIHQAQYRLRILSGLYGVLRPLDVIQPYRLEMGTPLETDRGRDLYAFWGDRITDTLLQDLQEQQGDTVVNLASSEYLKAVNADRLGARMITPTFKDKKNGKYRFLTFYGKKARGQMAHYLIRRRLKRPDSLKTNYNVDGYRYNAQLSTGTEWVFTRESAESG